MTLNSFSNCTANSSCAGFSFTKSGNQTNLALCVPSNYCTTSNEQVQHLIAQSYNISNKTINVQKKRCCETDFCIKYSDLVYNSSGNK
ncbi:unnamed protein product, partial [Brachionus calyciflorus]